MVSIRWPAIVLATSAPLLDGCVALGWCFGPGVSVRDPNGHFAEPPVVERRPDGWVLAWTQGRFPFFFEPSYEPIDDRLVFALAGTASSGNLAGRRRELRIEGEAAIAALEQGGAFFWEPEPAPRGSLLRLRVLPQASAPPRVAEASANP
jgi:hypothetical protein